MARQPQYERPDDLTRDATATRAVIKATLRSSTWRSSSPGSRFIQREVITLIVFTVFALVVFGQSLKWNYAVSYLFIVGAVYFAFKV
jgi:hypothetical protein